MKKIVHTRLGLNLGAQHLGWALIAQEGMLPAAEDREYGDTNAMLLRDVAEGEHVDLIGYADSASYAHSQAARDGLSWQEHTQMLLETIAFLKDHNRTASIKWVRVE